MKIKSLHKGFSLIELMAVVVIIALLFAFAIPAYQRYLARSQVARVVLESGNLKTAIETCINKSLLVIGKASEGKCDTNATVSNIVIGDSQGDLGNTPDMGVPQAEINPVTAEATIIATFGNRANNAISGDFIRWRRSVGGSWLCESTAQNKYNPADCP